MKRYGKSALLVLLALIVSMGGSLSALAADTQDITVADSIAVQDTETTEPTDPTEPEVLPELNQVTGLTCTANTASSVSLEWSENYWDDTVGYQVVRITSSGSIKELQTTTGTTAEITGLSQGTKYTFAVRAYGQSSTGQTVYGPYSESLAVATGPKATTVKTVRYVSKGKIKVTWNKRTKASGFLIQYSTSKKFSDSGRTITVKAAGTSTSKTISGLSATTYYVRVIPYKKVNGVAYYSSWSARKSVRVTKGLTVKERINRIDTSSNSGKAKIKEWTNNGVNIAKYSTTYDKVMAIYKWHVAHALEFESCLDCNSHFNDCLYQLFGQPTERNLWIAAGNYINNNGSKAIHKWSALYLAGVPYLFDPRMQKYVSASGTEYFGFSMKSTLFKKHYEHQGWYYCTNDVG